MTATTPDWLVQTEVGLCPCGCIGKRSKSSVVEKTLGGGARVMSAAMFSDDIAAKPGLLQAIDPRVKVGRSTATSTSWNNLVLRDARVHLIAPRQNSALHVADLLEPGLLQKIHRLRAAHSALAMRHNLVGRIQLAYPLRQLAQRN